MVKEFTVNHNPIPSEFIWRMHTLIFLWTPKGFISSEYFLNFFLDLYVQRCLQNSFKLMMLILLENKFVSQKIESVHIYS